MKNRNRLIVLELVLLFASILVFRSVWLLLDAFKWASTTTGLLSLLVPGAVLCWLAFKNINDDQ